VVSRFGGPIVFADLFCCRMMVHPSRSPPSSPYKFFHATTRSLTVPKILKYSRIAKCENDCGSLTCSKAGSETGDSREVVTQSCRDSFAVLLAFGSSLFWHSFWARGEGGSYFRLYERTDESGAGPSSGRQCCKL
jgi:hypothetical protein